MNTLRDFFTKVKLLFLENRKILIPIIPLVLFVMFFIFILFLPFITTQTPEPEAQSPTPTSASEFITRIPTDTDTDTGQASSPYHGEIVLYENNPETQQKETLPNNVTKYTVKSDVPNRPDIFVVQGEEQNDIFTRSVSSPNSLPTLPSYTDIFGSPTQIFQGSKFYGQNAQWYIYSNTSMAFVTRGGFVLEVHSFPALSIQTYLSQYNDDIVR